MHKPVSWKTTFGKSVCALPCFRKGRQGNWVRFSLRVPLFGALPCKPQGQLPRNRSCKKKTTTHHCGKFQAQNQQLCQKPTTCQYHTLSPNTLTPTPCGSNISSEPLLRLGLSVPGIKVNLQVHQVSAEGSGMTCLR